MCDHANETCYQAVRSCILQVPPLPPPGAHVVVFIALIVFTVHFKMFKILNNVDKTLVCSITIILSSASIVMLYKVALRLSLKSKIVVTVKGRLPNSTSM